MDTTALIHGVELMLLGMGIVFGFLTILVFTLRGMSKLADRLHPPVAAADTQPQPLEIADNRQLIAAISVAVARFRASRSA